MESGFASQASQSAGFLNAPIVAAVLPAIVGMLCAWVVTEVTNLVNIADRAHGGTSLNVYVGIWTAALEVIFVAILVGWDRAVLGGWNEAFRRARRAALPGAAVGFVAGYAAQAVYTRILENAFTSGDFSSAHLRVYLARALGWAIFGCGAGLTLGIADRSTRRAFNGAIGGFVGGAIGGAAFEWTAEQFSSDRTSRLVGLLAVAILVALATRVVETARREAWLRIVGGGMTGKEFILYHAVTRLGSSPECEIFLLKDPGIEPLHAQIEARGVRRHLSASPAAPVLVNNAPATSHMLRSGDVMQLGKTVIRYQERPSAAAAAS
jgi:hypothetical protein